MRLTIIAAGIALTMTQLAPVHATPVQIDSLDLSTITQDWGQAHAGRSVDNNPLNIGGQHFDHGIGTHANSEFEIRLDGHATEFTASVGLDDEKRGAGSIVFHVVADGKSVFDSPVLHGGDAAVPVRVPLAGVHTLILSVTDGGDGVDSDHADWADAQIDIPAGAAAPTAPADTPAPPRLRILPPNPAPRLHGPRVVGSTPGHPFLFLIPATGRGPLTFSASHLPAGLTLNAKSGVISGTLKHAGTTASTIVVRGPKGTDKETLTIVGGHGKLSLTPPMGWNSWNAWAGNIDQKKMQAAADSFFKSGLAAHGYAYVNIDDTWEDGRTASGEITSNRKFPSMPALANYVHAHGLKVGLYSSPGPKTCAGFEASYQHETQDADTYAKWGFDYLKYDWCSYGGVPHTDDLAGYKLPYQVMGKALDNTSRDIVYSLCQYGMGDVWKWGASVGGNCWRTTGDINDSWGSLRGIYQSQAGHEKYAGPGHWNDPDMLVVGRVGWGNPHPTHLKPNEQILHMSMWSMLAAPLMIGCDLDNLDPLTLALLTNDEVIDIDQDPLGRAARLAVRNGTGEVWVRPLADGGTAVALVNPHGTAQEITVKWKEIGIGANQRVRDLWLHEDEGGHVDGYAVDVPAHGCVLLKVSRR